MPSASIRLDTRSSGHRREQRRLAAPGLARRAATRLLRLARRGAARGRELGELAAPSACSRSGSRARVRRRVGRGGGGVRGLRERGGADAERSKRRRPDASRRASFGIDAGSRSLLYVTTPIEAGASGPVGGLFVSEDGGHTWRSANGDLLLASSGFGQGEAWGGAKGSRPSLGPVAASASHGLVAYAGLRGLRRSADGAEVQRHREDDRRRHAPGPSSTKRRTGPSPNLEGSWIEKRAPDRRILDLVRRALRSGRGARPIPTSASRPISSGPTARVDGGKTLGPGELREAGRGPLGEPRPRRHERLRHPLGPVRSEARLHLQHRHRPLPQRGRRRDLDELRRGRSARAGGTRRTGWTSTPRCRASCGAPSARPTTSRGRRCGAARDPDTFQGGVGVSTDGGPTWKRAGNGAARDGHDPRPRRSREPEGTAHALRHRLRPRGLQVRRRRRDLGAEERRPRAAAAVCLAH